MPGSAEAPLYEMINGARIPLTAERMAEMARARTCSAADVEAERDRRIQAGVTFGGVLYQTREADQDNIQGARQLAFAAIVLAGAKPGNLRWHGGTTDFVWIAADNSRVPMDAPTVMAFSTAVATAKSALIFAASDLKARIAAGEVITNCTDPSHWPA